jgi:hypothetical protein
MDVNQYRAPYQLTAWHVPAASNINESLSGEDRNPVSYIGSSKVQIFPVNRMSSDFRDFSQSIQSSVGTVSEIISWSLSSTFILINHSLIILSLNAKEFELFIAFLGKHKYTYTSNMRTTWRLEPKFFENEQHRSNANPQIYIYPFRPQVSPTKLLTKTETH